MIKLDVKKFAANLKKAPKVADVELDPESQRLRRIITEIEKLTRGFKNWDAFTSEEIQELIDLYTKESWSTTGYLETIEEGIPEVVELESAFRNARLRGELHVFFI